MSFELVAASRATLALKRFGIPVPWLCRKLCCLTEMRVDSPRIWCPAPQPSAADRSIFPQMFQKSIRPN
jgi:hypothetical protein